MQAVRLLHLLHGTLHNWTCCQGMSAVCWTLGVTPQAGMQYAFWHAASLQKSLHLVAAAMLCAEATIQWH
jgi:hypothetical protein